MSWNVNPDFEARLRGLAQASVSGEDFLRHIVEEKTGQAPLPQSSSDADERPAHEAEPEEWVRKCSARMKSHTGDNLPSRADEDISQESISADRGRSSQPLLTQVS